MVSDPLARHELSAERRERAAEARERHADEHLVVSEEALRRVVEESVHKAFAAVGLDADEPLEVQKDLAYLRTWRMLVQKGGTKAFLTAVGFITLGLLSAMLIGLGFPARVIALFANH